MATPRPRDPDDSEQACPFLVPVTADRIFVYPVGAFCRRPGRPVKVPAASTLVRLCSTPAHRTCPGAVAAAPS
jgi:hypothetical protein